MAEKITSVSWIEHDHKGETTQWWVRLDPPAIASRRSDGFRTINDHRGTLTFSPEWLDVLRTDTSTFQRSNLDYLLAPPTTFDGDGNPHASASSFGVAWSVSIVAGDEQRTLRFRRTYSYHECEIEEIILAERDTRQVIRKEIRERQRDDHTVTRSVAREQYRYNEAAPDGTFDIPEGRPIETLDHGYQDEIAAPSCTDDELAGIRHAIAANDRGWRNGDFNEVASVWRFWHFPYSQHDETKCLPTTLEWKTMVEAQRGAWSTWESTVESVHCDYHVWFPIGSPAPATSSDTDIPVRSVTYHVFVRTACERTEGSCCSYSNMFRLIRDEDGFRIIHWEIVTDEIEYRLGQA